MRCPPRPADSLYAEFATRLADEQQRSAIWTQQQTQDGGGDVCAAAQYAGEAAANAHTVIHALPLDNEVTFNWDGDGCARDTRLQV